MKPHRKRVPVATSGIAAVIALVVSTALIVVPALATPPKGVTTTPIAVGRFDAIDTKIKTKRASDLHVLENTIVPGGTFGWHSHPVPAW